MSYKFDEAKTRVQRGRFSVDEWIEFRERLNLIKSTKELVANGKAIYWYNDNKISERDFRILEEIIINGKTTAQLAYLGRTDSAYSWLRSNQGTPMSTRRVQQIFHDVYPEFHIQKTHKQNTFKAKIRSEQLKIIADIDIIKQCGRCGTKENLELHHLFPIALGGTNDKRNFVYLCHDCHRVQSLYFLERLREMRKGVTENEKDNPN
jgi:5-methylcytosine-specific restriction endonuclease McrA